MFIPPDHVIRVLGPRVEEEGAAAMIKAIDTRPAPEFMILEGNYGLTYLRIPWPIDVKIRKLSYRERSWTVVSTVDFGWGEGQTSAVRSTQHARWRYCEKYIVNREKLRGKGVHYVKIDGKKKPITAMDFKFDSKGVIMLDRYSKRVKI